MIGKVLLDFLSTIASLNKFMHACYGLSLPRKLWVMGYKGFMGYVGDFPASQLGRWDFLWAMGGYGLREVWVIRVSTVPRDDDPTHPPKVRVANGKVHMTISPENQRLCSTEVVGFLLLNLYLSASD